MLLFQGRGDESLDTIVFIGVNKFGSSREAIKIAKEIGYHTVLLTNIQKHMDQRAEYTDVDRMILCDLNDYNLLYQLIESLEDDDLDVKAIVSFVDPWCGQASKLAEAFGLHAFSTDGIQKMLDKSVARKLLEHTPYNPNFVTVTSLDDIVIKQIEWMMPVVIKLAQSNGSKDVYLCQTLDDFHENCQALKEKISEENPLIIEEYLDGPQYLIETLAIDGNIYILAIIEQTIEYINGHFIVTGYSIVHNYTRMFYRSLKYAIEWILEEFEFTHGPCHFEFRYFRGNWKLVEVNPRVSGSGMNTLVEAGTGLNIVKETLNLVLNKEVDLYYKNRRYVYAKYQVVHERGILARVTGRKRARNSYGVLHVFVRPRKGQLLTPPVSMGNRYAIIIAEGRSAREARINAEVAMENITFHLMPETEKKTEKAIEQFTETSTETKNKKTIEDLIEDLVDIPADDLIETADEVNEE